MFEPLRHVLLRHPKDAFRSQEHLDNHWKNYGFTAAPDFLQACSDYDDFVALLVEAGAETTYIEGALDTGLDSIYVHDPILALADSLVVCRMGKVQRELEPGSVLNLCQEKGWPIRGAIRTPGKLEGGDLIWLDEETVAIGVGYRTNLEGISQLRQITRGIVQEIVPVPLPHFRGPSDVLHLMSLISPIGPGMAVIYRPLLPVPFLEGLEGAGVRLIDVPDEEFETLGCNVLALAPNLSVMAEGNPVTRARIEAAGVAVKTYPSSEISLKGQGGPTCLTRPLVRSQV